MNATDVEVFYNDNGIGQSLTMLRGWNGPGWYWWPLPASVLHSTACGPFPTEAEALADARDF